MKHCNNCGQDKDKSEFHTRKASKDGLAHQCKDCQRKYDKARASSVSRRNARLDYQRSERGKLAHKRAQDNWLKRNKVKRQAHIIVGNAIRDGKMVRMPCEVCGDKKSHAHHDDYRKPLDVRWLCDTHHNDWHAANGEGAQ